MNLFNAVNLVFFLALVSRPTLALPQEAWEFVVNGSKLYCLGTPEERFWLCKGPNLSGVLDKKPDNKELPFLPLLQSKEGIEVELVISQFKNTNYAFDLQDQPIVFSISHYVDLDFNNMYTYFKNTVFATHCTHNYSKILCINIFDKALNNYKDKLKDLAYDQYIHCVSYGFFSEFKARKPNSEKINNEPVPCMGRDSFDSNEQELYEKLLPQPGREPNFDQAEHFFKILSAKKELPFLYTQDGCFARAHILAYHLSQAGFRTGKIWVAGKIAYPFGANGSWTYHVATIIYVNDGDSPTIHIVDPTFDNQHLLTVSEWLLKMHISTTPRVVNYPLPSKSEYFDDVVMAFSSHIPMWPFHYDGTQTYLETIDEAQRINKEYSQLLEAQDLSDAP